MNKTRRTLLKSIALTPFALNADKLMAFSKEEAPIFKNRLQYSINAYSFNSELRSGKMTFFDMMEFCAEIGMDAVDITGYYFSSYPDVPSNKELFTLKRKALDLGLDIAWTGVRNNFVTPDVNKRNSDITLIKNWLEASSKLGATIMRVFTGKNKSETHSRDEIKEWLIEDYKTCTNFGEENGVIVGLQNHDEFLFTSDEIINIINRVNSDWFGLVLDCGSLPSSNPYEEMEKLAPYARYWFVKEHVKTQNSVKTPADLKRIAKIIKSSDFQGYVSFESLKEGDTKEIIKDMFSTFKSAL
ncbi:sugar phosphate isomerase/epimerase family protein [Algibacter sp. R77976]|uniref:sugar phosphate isomerase/epimerase family protein n=1 Tax=Algibacter sp. R77976 TaxID=3093873 RepID=UPI0037C8BEDD